MTNKNQLNATGVYIPHPSSLGLREEITGEKNVREKVITDIKINVNALLSTSGVFS